MSRPQRTVILKVTRTSTAYVAPVAAPEPEQPMTQRETAAWLQMHPTELSRLTKAGLVPHARVGQSPRYLRSQLLAWLERQAA